MQTRTMGDVYGTFFDFSKKIAAKVYKKSNLAICMKLMYFNLTARIVVLFFRTLITVKQTQRIGCTLKCSFSSFFLLLYSSTFFSSSLRFYFYVLEMFFSIKISLFLFLVLHFCGFLMFWSVFSHLTSVF